MPAVAERLELAPVAVAAVLVVAAAAAPATAPELQLPTLMTLAANLQQGYEQLQQQQSLVVAAAAHLEKMADFQQVQIDYYCRHRRRHSEKRHSTSKSLLPFSEACFASQETQEEATGTVVS